MQLTAKTLSKGANMLQAKVACKDENNHGAWSIFALFSGMHFIQDAKALSRHSTS